MILPELRRDWVGARYWISWHEIVTFPISSAWIDDDVSKSVCCLMGVKLDVQFSNDPVSSDEKKSSGGASHGFDGLYVTPPFVTFIIGRSCCFFGIDVRSDVDEEEEREVWE